MKWVWRVLLGLIALLVLAVASLWGMSFRADAGVIHTSVEIAATPAVVWPWLREPEKLKSWVSWLTDVRQPSPDRQIWVMEDRNNGNMPVEIVGVLTANEPPRRLTIHTTTAGAFDGDQSYILTDLGGKTRLEVQGHYRFSQWFAQLMEPLISHEAGAKMADDLTRLKAKLEAAKVELEKLQGSWKVTSLEMNGQAAPPAMFQGAKLIIKGDTFESIVTGAVQNGTIEVNPSASPKAFDLIYNAVPERPAYRSVAIYELNGNTWRACFTARTGTRPTQFATSKGSGLVLDVTEREP